MKHTLNNPYQPLVPPKHPLNNPQTHRTPFYAESAYVELESGRV
jgi:hypothetical protein